MINLFKESSDSELNITKLTRPLSFWLVLLTFIILIFLNSFQIVKTDTTYLEILKTVLITMTGFYFTMRGIEKIAQYKYQDNSSNSTNSSNSSNSIDSTVSKNELNTKKEIIDSKNINPDKLI